MPSDIETSTEAAPAEARTTPSPPVDLAHLSRYTLGERALEREVLELFCTQSGVYLQRLREASSAREWKEAAHSLKGSALAIGAWRVAAAAEQAEAVSGEDLAATRSDRCRAVEASVGEADAFIRTLLTDR